MLDYLGGPPDAIRNVFITERQRRIRHRRGGSNVTIEADSAVMQPCVEGGQWPRKLEEASYPKGTQPCQHLDLGPGK